MQNISYRGNGYQYRLQLAKRNVLATVALIMHIHNS